MFSRQPSSFELPLKDRTSLVAQSVKDPPAETSVSKQIQVLSLGWEDLLEKEMATDCIIFAWKIP